MTSSLIEKLLAITSSNIRILNSLLTAGKIIIKASYFTTCYSTDLEPVLPFRSRLTVNRFHKVVHYMMAFQVQIGWWYNTVKNKKKKCKQGMTLIAPKSDAAYWRDTGKHKWSTNFGRKVADKTLGIPTATLQTGSYQLTCLVTVRFRTIFLLESYTCFRSDIKFS